MKTIDELNSITTEYEEVDIDTYFEPMDITEEQKEERKKAAEDLWWVLLLMFGLIKQSIEDGDLDYAFMYDTFKESYADVVEKYSRIDDYTTTYIDKFVQNTLDTTWNHIDFENPDSYWTSNKRALGIAVNEANTILNYEDLQRAIDNGMNVKIWHTQKDNRVRPDHRLMEGQKVGILEFFSVGDSQLLFPRDEVNCTNVRDIANCRCYAKADYDSNYNDRVSFEEKGKRTKKGVDYAVNWGEVKSLDYSKRLSVLSNNDKANTLIAKRARNALTNRDAKNTEELYAVSLTSGKDVSKIVDQNYPFKVKRTEKFNSDIDRATKNGHKVLLIHNHPNSTPPSNTDINALFGYSNVEGITVGHNGSIYYYTCPEVPISDFEYKVAIAHYKEYTDEAVRMEKALERLSEKHHFVFRKL